MATAKKAPAKKAPAKKQTPTVEAPIASFDNIEQTPKMPTKPQWEYRDRLYELTQSKKPLVFTIPTMHTSKKSLLYFDEEKGYQRELRYATNQQSPFVDEQKGTATLGRVVFREGALTVPKENVVLQKFLSCHPMLLKGIIEEYKPEAIAEYQVDYIEMELEAMNLATSLDIDEAEAIMRVQIGSKVSEMSSKELKRDLLVFARNNAKLFLDIANDDNVHLRNIGIKATEMGILRLSQDQRTFYYADTDRKIMTVPFDEHPYSALAAYFKTDEGMEVLNVVEKRL
ncbi:MAG: hypothetical protein CMJ25_26945 [Phycisphaerae bacterium]|nr:hypothetical protein [Phycisphaerae bacterium]